MEEKVEEERGVKLGIRGLRDWGKKGWGARRCAGDYRPGKTVAWMAWVLWNGRSATGTRTLTLTYLEREEKCT